MIDPYGGTHSLARRVEGAKAKDIRARMSDVDPELLPSVAEARVIQKQRQAERERLISLEALLTAELKERQAKDRGTTAPLEWTDRGGMVAQQESALHEFQRAEQLRTKGAVEQTREIDLTEALSRREIKRKAAEEAALRANDPPNSQEPGGRGRSR